MKQLLFFLVFVFLTFPYLCRALTPSTALDLSQNADITKIDSSLTATKSPTGAMLRSLFVPGWGQFYNDKWFKALVIGGTEIGLVANAVYQNQMAAKANDPLEREWYIDNRNLSYWWLLGTILFSMADAYVDAHLYHFDESPNLSDRQAFEPNFQANKTGAYFSLIFRF